VLLTVCTCRNMRGRKGRTFVIGLKEITFAFAPKNCTTFGKLGIPS
jgi:hypothetical protein